ncbi:uncharacterized protein LOC105692322 [Athalia rosae]|uniref:uncharacterized protein LOC105692322 n=1 Tax=Athalia rosae TaxID=37344 RepID=UPI000625BCE4|nr:uncharacterized protein LOC105692322 [Athalia rosae]
MSQDQKMHGILNLLLICSYFVVVTCSNLWCFKCTATREDPNGLACSEFDWSQNYQVECPKSTMCRKKTSTIPLANGQEIKSIERDCAPQLQDVHKYDFARREWNLSQEVVETAYSSGCTVGENKGRPGPPTEYCYCYGHFCNQSNSIGKIGSSLILLHILGLILCSWAHSKS